MNGIDVSSWQHAGQPIDWTEVKAAGYDFVIVKLTEGLSYTNPFARNDIEAARAAGLVVGGYCFASPLGAPHAQAAYGLDCARTYGVDYVFVDVEASLTGELPLADTIIKQYQLQSQQMGIQIGVYGSLDTLQGLNVGNTGTPVWGAFPHGVPVPDWNNIVCIQSGQATIAGINVETDIDEWVKGDVLGVKPTDPTPTPTSATEITTATNEPVAEPYPTATYAPRHPIVIAGDEVVGITAAPTPGGAWALTKLGQVLCYAGANYWGEPGEVAGGWVDIVSTGNGYLCVDAAGEVTAFGVAVQNAPKA